ncbi:MAG: HEPN domain-containing protein [Deltaproteobacteria bacterium]|nr:HEPN domain-containing protein [Deltaproteobacteria bacterium]
MKPEVNLLIDKANRSLIAAEMHFEKGDYDFCASRSYYAMFYAAEGILLEKGKTYSKHSGVLSGFYHHFIATKIFPQRLHEAFHHAFDDRQDADYAFLDPFPKEEAQNLLKEAKKFVEAICNYLKTQN